MSSFFGGGSSSKGSSSETENIDRTTTFEREPALTVDSRTSGGLSVVANPDGTTRVVDVKQGITPRKAIDEGLTRSRSSLDRIEQTIADLRSNTNDFINARVRPFEEINASRVAATERSFGRRRVFGSLSANSISDVERAGERDVADQRALATREALQGILQAEGVADQVNSNIFNAATQLLQTDLGELGISLDALRLSHATRQITSERTVGTSTRTGSSKQKSDDGGNILGDIATIGGFFL